MFVRWITQNGLIFDDGKTTVMVDPYLSDSVGKLDEKKHRRIPVDESMFDITPDIILITHEHGDHLDFETLARFLSGEREITVLAPYNAYMKLKELGGIHNYVMLRSGSVWSDGGITIYAVRAEHSDLTAAGFIIDDGKKTYYVSGDTLYNYDVIDDVIDLCEDGVDYAFIPINGKGNNMNIKDASDFAAEIGAKCAVPVHYGLFDDIDGNDFDYDDKIILEPYKRIKLM